VMVLTESGMIPLQASSGDDHGVLCRVDVSLESATICVVTEGEKFKCGRAKKLEGHKAIESRHQISFKATLDFGTMACRPAPLLDGAAAISVMTLIGHQEKMTSLLSWVYSTFATLHHMVGPHTNIQ
jgi:hypothetical protein